MRASDTKRFDRTPKLLIMANHPVGLERLHGLFGIAEIDRDDGDVGIAGRQANNSISFHPAVNRPIPITSRRAQTGPMRLAQPVQK